ncbi:WD40 repeat-like protein [Fomitiporia mediterranea MF3/22]|uniref:WD40 repeat-like protein n=1 Tax=Fomitiporia mediterranea (strain MF3/22) TaxID=694068 RepID=UPI0004409CC4|nr:WD40 repeat-like protein [Fomitiporia mediterranea MF3/22]EJD03670.1 WD40 repeat-like protein [Fomitiporia mediterranea MF3/22]
MGEFEDAWEDEIESDEEVVEGKQDANDGEGMDVDEVLPPIEESEEQQPERKDVYLPGRHVLAKDEILEPDDSVYEMRHSLNVDWPCLSFDVLRDSLGDERQRYPATAYIVTGTQADYAKNNELRVYKMSSLHRTQKDGDESDSDEDDNNDDLDEDAVLEHRSVPHLGGVNRIRAQPLPPSTPLPPVNSPYYVASWAETGKVHIWDVRPLIESLDVPGYSLDKKRSNTPVHTINSHGRAEGFALDWAADSANPAALRLLTGDVHSKIFLTTTTQSGFVTQNQPFTSHTSSVEDLQWSPAEPTVFASCSADQSVRIWDIRMKGRKNALAVTPAHENDVNVISWNRSTSYLLLSGGDEGGIKVWDLRNFSNSKPTPSPVACFMWHKAPITSIEWHPSEDSIFAASGADDQVTLWDLAVEQDDDEAGVPMEDGSQDNVPPQLLFVHQGQKDVKEVHWHPQIPGAVISTAYDGFNIFKTISV